MSAVLRNGPSIVTPQICEHRIIKLRSSRTFFGNQYSDLQQWHSRTVNAIASYGMSGAELSLHLKPYKPSMTSTPSSNSFRRPLLEQETKHFLPTRILRRDHVSAARFLGLQNLCFNLSLLYTPQTSPSFMWQSMQGLSMRASLIKGANDLDLRHTSSMTP